MVECAAAPAMIAPGAGRAPPRLYVAPAKLNAGDLVIDGDDHHYLFRVRRSEPGDLITLFDGEGAEASAEVVRVDAATAVVRVAESQQRGAAGCRLRIAVGLIKGDRMDWCVQKLVELGADEIVLMQTERAVVRLDSERAAARRARLDAVARDAARQCRRTTVPAVAVSPSFAATLARLADCDVRVLAHTAAAGDDLYTALPHSPAAPTSAALLVGPEGGFTMAEIDAAMTAGWAIVGLGTNVLRAETAAVVGTALLGSVLSHR